jgi:hypothetical protein
MSQLQGLLVITPSSKQKTTAPDTEGLKEAKGAAYQQQ